MNRFSSPGPNEFRRLEVPRVPERFPGSGEGGELLNHVNVTMEINGQVFPVTVVAEVDPDDPNKAYLKIIDRREEEPMEIPPVDPLLEEDGVPDDKRIRKMLRKFERQIPPLDYDQETIISGLGGLAATEMIGGAVVGVKDDRIDGIPEYEPVGYSVIPEVTNISGTPEPMVRLYEFEDSPSPRPKRGDL